MDEKVMIEANAYASALLDRIGAAVNAGSIAVLPGTLKSSGEEVVVVVEVREVEHNGEKGMAVMPFFVLPKKNMLSDVTFEAGQTLVRESELTFKPEPAALDQYEAPATIQ